MDHRAGLDDDFDGGFVLRTKSISNAVSPFEPPKRNSHFRAVPPGAGGPFDRGQWTSLTIAALERLWGLNYSTAAIGEHLQFTKNAIVGKAHRLDLAARPSPITRNPDSSYARRLATPRAAPRMTLPPLASVAAEIPIAIPRSPTAAPRLSRAIRTPIIVGPAAPIERVTAAPKPYGRIVECCWPIGNPGTRGFRFCEVPSVISRPYCEAHVQIAYVKIRDRREDATI
jgi:GcrA cell cycle regulator